MALDKLVDSSRLNGALEETADAIRTKTGGTSSLLWDMDEGFSTQIGMILTPTDGSIPTKTSADMSVDGGTVTAPAGYYATDASASVAAGSATTPATTITSAPSISVNASGLITATNSKTQSVTPTVSAGYVTAGTAGTITVSGSNTSQLTTKAATSYTPGTTDQTIASGTYLTGTQTIKGDSDLTAGNIKKGVEIFGVTGTFTTTPSGKTALAAAALRSGYAGFINGDQVNGNMPDATFANTATSGKTYTDISSSGPVLIAGDYLYINEGYTPYSKISLAKLVPDGSDVKGHGEYLLSGHSAYDNDGTLVAGTIPTLASTDVSVSGKTVTIPVGKYTGASGATAISVNIDEGAVTTSFTGDGMSTYFNNGTSSDKNVTITPKYTNTAGYVAAHSTATSNGGTAYYKIKTTSASLSGDTVSYGTGWITAGSKTVAGGTITNNTTLPSGSSSSGTITSGAYIKIGTGYYGSDTYYVAQSPTAGTITNNTTLPSGSSSSGTINRGSYIKIGAGNYASDAYYLAQANSGTKTITGSGNTSVDGYATASVAAVSGSIGGSASGGSATAAISNVNSMNTISDVSGKTAGTDYWAVKATATGSAGSYTPKYTVSTAGWIASTVTGTAQSVSVSSDSTGKSIYIPKATFDKDGATVYCKTAGYIPAGSASSGVGTIGNGTVVASVSSNTGGSASIAATGFTPLASGTSSYYVTLSTSAGSVKAKATGGTSGYVTSSTTNETAATSVAVSGNGTKIYIPAGGYSGSVSSHSITTTPVVTGALSGTGTNIGTTTKPSGTDGTDYWAFTPGGSVTTTGVSTAKGKATISTAGYIPTGNNESSASTVNITPTASNGTTRYITKATSSSSSGTASATAGTASASVTGMVTTTTNTGYSVSASATGGSSSVTASSVTVGAGYNPSSVTASTTAKSATGTSASETKYIQKGVLSASVSSNSGGSASMAATGFTPLSSGTSSYYVTLSTSAGSVKAKASVGTEGYVKSETNETGATSVAVSGNGTKLYVPAGGYSGSVSSHSITTVPVVTGALSGTGTNIGTTTKPSGTDGTDYWVFTPGGSVTTTGVSTAKGKATISTAGYIPAGNNESGAHTVNITPTASNGTTRYITKATSSTSNGTASATANAGTASIAKDPSASATATANGMDGGYYTDSTTSSYYVDCSASAASGYSTATGGSASASVTASSVTVGAGYNPSSVTASTTASSTGNKTGNTATSTEKTASASKKIYLKPAAIAGSSTNATATTTVAPGNVTIANNTTAVSGKTRIDSGVTTATTGISTYYMAIKASAAANSTGTTSSISGSGTATVSSAGYAPTTLTGSVSVSGTATAKTSAKDSSVYYIPLATATFDVSGASVYCKSGGWVPTGSTSSVLKTIGNGTVVASVSSNSGGSAAMGTTGFVASPTATSYYVTLATSPGSVKAKAVGGTAGYVTSSTTNETADTSVSVSGNGNKVYIPEGSITNNTYGGSSSGTINRGSQIKISKGYHPNDVYYTAQANSGTKTISSTGTISVDGYANISTSGLYTMQQVFPVGSLYATENSTTNPSTLLGFGTWTKYAPTTLTWNDIKGTTWSASTTGVKNNVYVWKRTA